MWRIRCFEYDIQLRTEGFSIDCLVSASDFYYFIRLGPYWCPSLVFPLPWCLVCLELLYLWNYRNYKNFGSTSKSCVRNDVHSIWFITFALSNFCTNCHVYLVIGAKCATSCGSTFFYLNVHEPGDIYIILSTFFLVEFCRGK